MAKLTREQKLEIYYKIKEGNNITILTKEYDISKTEIKYLIRLIDIHGENILRKDKNNYYSPELKLEIINKVLNQHQSITFTAVEYGLLSKSILISWLKFYKRNGYTIVEKKQGRPPTMKKVTKSIDPDDKDAIIKIKDAEILKLKAENEYLNKLRAVVQTRKNQQPKRK